MSNEPDHELEDAFQQRNERLLDFFAPGSNELSTEEQNALLPILNSLADTAERYEELAFLAEGGEKRITRVYDRRLNRQVALARAVNAKTRRDQERFLREAQLEANLTHPNIVPVYDIGIDAEGVPFFTMEFIQGDSLKTVIQKLREGDESYRQAYPPDTLLNIFLKVCDAMAYVHSRNVLHLDIKPDNIRVGKYGEIFICDWGVAKIIHQDSSNTEETPGELDGDLLNDLTLSGTIKGTPGFMAPEQTEADGQKTAQTDIYALGALLYILLTYELPVKGRSRNEILDHTRRGMITPPSNHKRHKIIPHSLSAVAMKALALKPENRYTDVNELHREISRYLSGFPTKAERAGLVSSLSLLIKRHSWAASLILFFLAALTLVISTNLFLVKREEAAAAEADKRAKQEFQEYQKKLKASRQLNVGLKNPVAYALKPDYSRAHQRIRILEGALRKTTAPEERKELLLQKGAMHFVLEHFRRANSCFEEARPSGNIDQDLWRLSKKYATEKANDRNLLTLQQLTALINEADIHNTTVFFLYLHHMKRVDEVNPKNYLPLATAMLNKLNRIEPGTEENHLRLQKRPNGLHLDLRHAPYYTFTLSPIGREWVHILEPFNPYSIDISHLPLRSFTEMEYLPVQELTMTGLSIKRKNTLPPRLKKMGPKKIFIDTNAYPPAIIEEIQKKHQVIHKDAATKP